MHDMWEKMSRHMTLTLLFFLPQRKKKSLERRLRGREEFRKLQYADYILVSFGKSGRTWLRVMLSRFYQLKHDLPQRYLLGFDNLHRKNPNIPSVFFTHGNYLRDYTKNWDSKIDFYGKRIILLVRDPRDIAVSQFFQWKYRMRPGKKVLNDYPAHGKDISIFNFVMDSDAGLPKIIAWLNGWEREIPQIGQILLVRYEDMRTKPAVALKAILAFLGTPGTDEQVEEAVAFATYDNMKKLEQKKVFWLSGRRLLPRDRTNPDSYKVRRAKIGGYRDYFNDEEIVAIETLVNRTLAPSYGYTHNCLSEQQAAIL
jgi:hypothetical protein